MLENLLSNDSLEVARIRAETNRLKDQVRELEAEISKRNEVLNKVHQKINHANVTVQRKQNHIDILNRKFQRLLKDNGVGYYIFGPSSLLFINNAQPS